jgi:hypothetical protein
MNERLPKRHSNSFSVVEEDLDMVEAKEERNIM